jgi:hypothetical protein
MIYRPDESTAFSCLHTALVSSQRDTRMLEWRAPRSSVSARQRQLFSTQKRCLSSPLSEESGCARTAKGGWAPALDVCKCIDDTPRLRSLRNCDASQHRIGLQKTLVVGRCPVLSCVNWRLTCQSPRVGGPGMSRCRKCWPERTGGECFARTRRARAPGERRWARLDQSRRSPEKKALNRLSMGRSLRRSIKGGPGWSVAALRAMRRRDRRRLRGRMMNATTAEKSAKKNTRKTVSTRTPSGRGRDLKAKSPTILPHLPPGVTR